MEKNCQPDRNIKLSKIFMNRNFHNTWIENFIYSWIEIFQNHEFKFYKNIKELYMIIKLIYKFRYNVMHSKFVRDKI